jgi:protocatechuate 3,4-dioxygenase beta subunit
MHDRHDDEPHDLGLSHDLPTLLDRRRALGLLSGAGLAAALAACSADDSASAASSSTSSSPAGSSASATTAATGTEIPEETAGPFPGDGSNGVNVLTESGIVRSNITSSFGTGSGVATGVPLTITLKVLDTANGSAPLEGAAVYLWHCDQSGRYSLYSDGATDENYLRGVQAAAADGTVTFTSIYPAAYTGRWPHIHFEVYPSLADATKMSGKLRTSQVALPEKASRLVYATDGYDASIANLAQTSLQTDIVFSDGWSLQLGTVTGDADAGMTVSLNVPV